MGAAIRPATAEDLDSLYDIAVKTADAGADATALYADPRLVGHIYMAPYVVLLPDWSFVAEDADGVAGYVVGAPDTDAFAALCEKSWWPELRLRYPDPGPPYEGADAGRIYQIHHPEPTPPAVIARYGAHMHMNLLPRLRGQGLGRALFGTWRDRASAAGLTGVHVGVNRHNKGGAAFWQACGMTPIADADTKRHPALWFGMRLP